MAKMTSAVPCKMQEAVTSSAIVQVALTNILARELSNEAKKQMDNWNEISLLIKQLNGEGHITLCTL